MAKKIINLMNLERDELYRFCDHIPEPYIAEPVVKSVKGGGLTLVLKYANSLVNVVEGGKPCVFPSYDMVVDALCEAENVDISSLLPKTAYFQFTPEYGLN